MPDNDVPESNDEPTVRVENGVATILVRQFSNVHSVAGAVLHTIRSGHTEIEVRGIGAGAVNQAAKACAIARSIAAAEEGMALTYAIAFRDVRIQGNPRSVLVFQVVIQPLDAAA